jgi:prepilin-type N-terminal cleavage/methylation domain-containing protein
MFPLHKHGFTLVELLVGIAIIGLLASVILASINVAREQAQIARITSVAVQIRNASTLYIDDTGFTPPNCSTLNAANGGNCVQNDDPFLNDLSVANWDGPYLKVWDNVHGWGGQLGIYNWLNENGAMIYGIMFNDDRPGTSPSDNGGPVPPLILQKLDETFDDGDLTTGRFRGNPGITPFPLWGNFPIPPGEGLLMLDTANCPPGMLQTTTCFAP